MSTVLASDECVHKLSMEMKHTRYLVDFFPILHNPYRLLKSGGVELGAGVRRDTTDGTKEEATATESHMMIHMNVMHIAPLDCGPLCEP